MYQTKHRNQILIRSESYSPITPNPFSNAGNSSGAWAAPQGGTVGELFSGCLLTCPGGSLHFPNGSHQSCTGYFTGARWRSVGVVEDRGIGFSHASTIKPVLSLVPPPSMCRSSPVAPPPCPVPPNAHHHSPTLADAIGSASQLAGLLAIVLVALWHSPEEVTFHWHPLSTDGMQ